MKGEQKNGDQRLLRHAISRGEVREFLNGQQGYSINQKMNGDIVNIEPQDYSGVTSLFHDMEKDNPASNARDIFCRTLLQMLREDCRIIDFYTVMNLVFSQLWKENKGCAAFTLDNRDEVLQEMKRFIHKHRAALAATREWAGRGCEAGLMTVAENTNAYLKAEYGLSFLE